jgi:hypothetical protein
MDFSFVSDTELLDSLKEGFMSERNEQYLFLIRLAEVDRRGLWKKTDNSLNQFCQRQIGVSASTAWKRIQVCHLGVRIPYALELLKKNLITMTNLSILSPCLNLENAEAILTEACGKGRYAVEAIRARYLPRPEPRDSITPIAVSPSSAKENQTTRVRISFVADESLVKAMNKVKSLLSHQFPNARLEEIEAEVYRFYLEAHDLAAKEPKVKTKQSKPARHTRYTPVEVEKAVWRRDQSRCTYRYENGERCNSEYQLEMDHCYPFCDGGRSDIETNRRLLCSFHNKLEAEKTLGKKFMNNFRKKSSSGLNDPITTKN